jgi:hypothetical protein
VPHDKTTHPDFWIVRDAQTRSAGNTVDVNENKYAVASFEQKLAAVRKLESAIIQ